jgi:hypothetical protein
VGIQKWNEISYHFEIPCASAFAAEEFNQPTEGPGGLGKNVDVGVGRAV